MYSKTVETARVISRLKQVNLDVLKIDIQTHSQLFPTVERPEVNIKESIIDLIIDFSIINLSSTHSFSNSSELSFR